MKLSTSLSVAISFLALSFWATAQTSPLSSETTAASVQIPRLIRFSGIAKDETGKAISGVLGITVALYQDEQGGAPLWLETQNVQADAAGHYTALLGSTTPDGVPLALFTSAEVRWISTQISGQIEQPRVALLSVPYALKAADAETLGGLPASAFVQSNAVAPPTWSGSSKATLATPQNASLAEPSAAISGSGTTNFVPLWTTSTTLGNSLIYQNNGMLGVGTTTPKSAIDVHSATTAVSGTSTGAGKAGVYGLAPGFGVQGIGNSATATGVSGIGAQYGVTATAGNDQPNAAGVYGAETSATSTYPVYGVEGLVTTSQKGIGVYGLAQASTGSTVGVKGVSSSPSGNGVSGSATATTGSANGIFGQTASTGGAGGLFQNTSSATGAKILVAEDSSGTQRFSVDTRGNVDVVTGTTTQVKGPLLPVNHARTTVTVPFGDTLVTLDWAFAFPDTSYTATCSYVSTVLFESGTGVWGFTINSVSASSLKVDVAAYGNGTPITIHCIGVHD